MYGYDVTVYDLSSDVLRDAAAKVRAYAEGLVEKKRLCHQIGIGGAH